MRGRPPDPRLGTAGAETPASAPRTIADEVGKGRPGSGARADVLKIGDRVLTAPTFRPTRYADRPGTIVSLNVRDDEIGVWLGNYGSDGHRSVIWFRSREVAVADTATTAQQAPVLPPSAVLSIDMTEQAL